MLPRQYRLPANFRLTHPQTYTTPYFMVKYSSNNLPHARFGFVIGKAVAKQAVHRNRARRLLRSCLEERIENIRHGVDMLFLLKKGIIGVEREILNKEIHVFLEKKSLFT